MSHERREFRTGLLPIEIPSTPPRGCCGAEVKGGSIVGPGDVAAAVQAEEEGEDGENESDSAEEVDPLELLGKVGRVVFGEGEHEGDDEDGEKREWDLDEERPLGNMSYQHCSSTDWCYRLTNASQYRLLGYHQEAHPSLNP